MPELTEREEALCEEIGRIMAAKFLTSLFAGLPGPGQEKVQAQIKVMEKLEDRLMKELVTSHKT